MKPGDVIRQRRLQLKITQEDLAEYADVSLRLVKSIESGNANPTWSTLEKLTCVLGLDIEFKIKQMV